LHGTGDAAFVLIDPSRLMTAILNLAIMARDAMPGGGRLTLATANADQTNRLGVFGRLLGSIFRWPGILQKVKGHAKTRIAGV
jgi:hypothetical protein